MQDDIPPTPWETLADRLNPLTRAAQKLETAVGFFFATFLTLLLAGLIAYMLEDACHDRGPVNRAGWSLAALAWLCLDVPYLIRLWRTTLRGPAPALFETANRQRLAPLPLRPLITLWWLAHFAMAAWFSLLTTTLVNSNDRAANHTLNFLLATSYGYATNGYLINATCALTRSPRLRQFIWHRRHTIDLALGLASLFIPPNLLK